MTEAPDRSLTPALDELRSGGMAVLVDPESFDEDGELVLAAVRATPQRIAFMLRHTCGILHVAMPADDLDRLCLPPMVASNESGPIDHAVSVDARAGITSGVSAADRTRTISLLADPDTQPDELRSPGHVFPIRTAAGGVLRRAAFPEAATDLIQLAGCGPSAVTGTIVDHDGMPLRGEPLRAFAAAHGLPMVTVAELIDHRRRTEPLVERMASSLLPTCHGNFRAYGYRCILDDRENIALVSGDLTAADVSPPLVRVQTECLMGDVFTSARCDCGPRLHRSLDMVAAAGRGVVIYLRRHQTRGLILPRDCDAATYQDEATHQQDCPPVSMSDIGIGAQILTDLGVRNLRLLTIRAEELTGLERYGIQVSEAVRLASAPESEAAELWFGWADSSVTT